MFFRNARTVGIFNYRNLQLYILFFGDLNRKRNKIATMKVETGFPKKYLLQKILSS